MKDPAEKLARLEALNRAQAEDARRSSASSPTRAGIYGVLAIVVIVLAKSKGVLFLIFSKFKFLLVVLKAAKFSSFLLTFGTMLTSMALYSRHYGAPFAVGFVLLILVHEIGHGVAARLCGLKVGAPIFIPFFGALIALKDQPKSKLDEAIVGAGGPVFGFAGASLVAVIAYLNVLPNHTPLFHAVAHFTYIINLFNMLPVFGLDGDRIARPFKAKTFLITGGAAVGLLSLLSETFGRIDPNLVLITILLFIRFLTALYSRSRAASKLEKLDEISRFATNDVSLRDEVASCLCFVGLLALLCFGAALTQAQLLYKY